MSARSRIATFCGITHCDDQDVALAMLVAHDHDVEAAVAYYFDSLILGSTSSASPSPSPAISGRIASFGSFSSSIPECSDDGSVGMILQLLPMDVVARVFSFLKLRDLVRACCSCRTYYAMSVNPQLWQPIYNKLCPSNSRQFWSQSAADALVFQRQTAGATLPTSPNNVVDYRLACLEFLSHSHRWLTPCPSKTVALHDQALKSVDFRPESQKKSKSPFKTDEGGRILAMAMAPRSSNMWCALATKDHKLHLRDARSGRLLRCTEVHHSGITQLEFSNCSASQAKSSLLVGASRDGSILLWDVQAAKDPVVEYDLHTRPVHSLAVSDNWCLSGGVDGGVYALHLPSALTGKQSYTPLCLQGGGGTVESLLLWDGAEGVAVAAGLDRVISVWSLPGFSPPADVVHHNATRLEGHTRDVTDMCWISSTSPTLFASCGRDNTARVWNLAEQRCVTVLDRHSSAINRVVAVDESKLFTACDDRLIRRFDIETGVLESTYTAGAHGVTMMAANRHRIVAANPRENVLYLFDPRSAKRAGVLTPGATGPAALSSSASSAVSNVSTMRIVDEDRLLVGHKDGAAFMYDFRRLKS